MDAGKKPIFVMTGLLFAFTAQYADQQYSDGQNGEERCLPFLELLVVPLNPFHDQLSYGSSFPAPARHK